MSYFETVDQPNALIEAAEYKDPNVEPAKVNELTVDKGSSPSKWGMRRWNENPDAIAAQFGLHVVLPAEDELQLDIDSEAAFEFMENQLKILSSCGLVRVLSRRETTSRSGNRHVYLKLSRRINPSERIAFQAALGSDLKRELYSIIRVMAGDHQATLLFEKNE